jgi:glycosyltransferase involved in cell wall biosynthesis
MLAGLGRALGYRIYVHYHSFKNMGKRTPMMSAFIKACGPTAVHIVLGPSMADGLRRHYPEASEIAILSNAVFMSERCPARTGGARLRIGHLSNLSRAKGLDGVISAMRAIRSAGGDVELVLGGPAVEADARRSLEAARREFGERLIYLGPLPQSELERFYYSIDAFLFPTLYQHEAEPLVVIEALSFGVPVFATDRGCIRDLVGAAGGRVFQPDEFVDGTVRELLGWVQDRDRLRTASRAAQARFLQVRAQARSELDHIVATIAQTAAVRR